jgi:hypothetical protein
MLTQKLLLWILLLLSCNIIQATTHQLKGAQQYNRSK